MSAVSVVGVDEWAAVCSRSFVPLRVRSGDDRFAASLTEVRLTDSIHVTRVRSTASEVFRDHTTIRRNPRDDVLLSIQGRGRGAVHQAGRRATIASGSAALYDASTPYLLEFPSRMSEIVLQLPRSALGIPDRAIPEITARRIDPGTGSMAVLTSLVCGVFADVGRTGVESSGERLASAVVDLLRTTVRAGLGAESSGPLGRDALRATVMHFIEANHLNPSVTPAAIATRHRMSLRQLQLLLAEAGETPAELLRRLRLAHGLRLLEQGASVGLAAAASGFDDTGTFTRAFKRTYDRLPSDVCSGRRLVATA
ncbi:AraC-like ligand-binding domain-containing protein [Agromyces bauzanensis]